MLLLAVCSLVALTVIVYKWMGLQRARILPARLEAEVDRVEQHMETGTFSGLQSQFGKGESALARLCGVALTNAGRTQGEVKEAVQSSAREEVVRMNSGLPVLDVVITIAPLLGLLGTASGLVTAFSDFSDGENIKSGIAKALSTTIVGIAITVPAVIAQSIFSRRIELFAARLEVLLGRVVSACHQSVFFKGK